MIGIYYIRNKIDNKIYIGSSKNIEHRIKTHFLSLARGKHANIHFQRAYVKYGKQNFETGVLEECSLDDLLKREYYYINYYNSLDPNIGYNIAKIIKTENNYKQYEPKVFLNGKQIRIIKILLCIGIDDKSISEHLRVPLRTIKGIASERIYVFEGCDDFWDYYCEGIPIIDESALEKLFTELKLLGEDTSWINKYFIRKYNITKFDVDFDEYELDCVNV